MENEISKKKSNRVIYFDILNIIAIIAVIAMHCNSIVHGKPNSTAWITQSYNRMYVLLCSAIILYAFRSNFNEL